MNKTNPAVIILLLLAIGLGVFNLYRSSSPAQSSIPVSAGDIAAFTGGEMTGGATAIHDVNGTFVSLSGNSLVVNVENKNTELTLGSTMKFYLRESMSDAKYQIALKTFQTNPVVSKQGDSTGGSITLAVPPIKDYLNQVDSVGKLNLKAGDNLTVALQGDLASGKTILEIVKVVHL